MIAGTNVGLSRKPEEDERRDDRRDTAPGTPHGLRYGRFAFGYLRRRITNDDHLQQVGEHGAPHGDVQHDRSGDGTRALGVERASTSSTTRATKPMTAPATSATHGVWRLPVSERNFG